MEKKQLSLKISITAMHEPETDTIYVKREDSEFFCRALETVGASVVRHDTIGNPLIPFWFDSSDQADAIFKMWASDY